jgi:hypothetical protein
MRLQLPAKGFTKSERIWLEKLIEEIETVRAVAGRNTAVSEKSGGQVIDAADCDACPPCP